MIRTIKFWVNYDPAWRCVVESARFKKLLHPLKGCIIFQVKGTYAMPRAMTRSPTREAE